MSSSTFPKSYSVKTNHNLTSKCCLFTGLVVAGILDVEKLESAHRRLVELWPAVGGSLVKSTTPYSFTTGSNVDFKSRSLPDKRLEDLPMVHFSETLPDRPTFHNMKWMQYDSVFHFGTVEQYPPPKQLFALRVTILHDATLLGFKFSHHLFDGQAVYDVVEAYCALLSGESIPKLVPPPDITSLLSESVTGTDNLPASVNADHPHLHPSANFTLGITRQIKGIGGILIKSILAKVGLSDAEDERMVHIPEVFVKQLREDCQRELDEATKSGELAEGSGLDLTKNDVLTAWFIKGIYAGYPSSDTKAVDMLGCLNYRRFLTPLPKDELFLHNTFYLIRTHFPSVSYLQTASVARIALDIRLTNLRNAQPSAVKSALQFWEKNVKRIVTPSPPDRSLGIDHVPIVSHWTTFEYAKLDFSSALKEGAAATEGSGKVLYTQPALAYPFNMMMTPTIFTVKDNKGGYWVRATLLRKGWKGLEEMSGCQ